MARSQNTEEYADRLADDRQMNAKRGRNLRKARIAARTPGGEAVTFEWLSKVTTLHHGSIRRFEKGESGVTAASLVRLKDALGCSWDDLLDGCASGVVKARKAHLK